MSESSQSRVEKVNKVEELQNTKASLSGRFTKLKEELVSAVSSAAEPAKVISSLHHSCDWLLQNFGTQKTARAEEVEQCSSSNDEICADNYNYFRFKLKGKGRSEQWRRCICTATRPSRWTVIVRKCCPGSASAWHWWCRLRFFTQLGNVSHRPRVVSAIRV